MATASTTPQNLANSATRQVKAISKRASAQGHELQDRIVRESRLLGDRAIILLDSAATSTRKHPWAAAGIVALAGAIVGGLLWSRRR